MIEDYLITDYKINGLGNKCN